MRRLLYIMYLLCLSLTAAAQESYLDVDFSNGIPDSFVQTDNDRNEPSADMKAIGFGVGKGWIDHVIEKEEGNHVACSTSWYAEAGTSDDWLITPAFTVKSGADILRWRAMAYDKRHRDGYAVYVSEDGGADVTDFDTTSPLFSITEEEASWTSRTVSLAAYEGKTIRIAFVNNSTDCNRLYIDDIFAGRPSSVYMTVGLPETIDWAGNVTVAGEAYTEETEPVRGFTVTFEYGGQTLLQTFDSVLTAGRRVPFTLDEPLVVANNSRLGYKATISHEGTSYTTEGTLTALARKNLIEESTGTWCGWCVRGIVALADIAANHADRFVSIAVHNGDVMTDEAYDEEMNALNPGGYPKMIINRDKRLIGDPLYAESLCRQADTQAYPYTGIDMIAAYDGGTGMVEVTAQVFFPADADTMECYRLGYALIENDVHDADDLRYAQNNSYSGGANGTMGGYENMPQYVLPADMYYQEVARGFFGSFNGIEGSVPATVKAMRPNAHTFSFALPESVMNIGNVEVVVMLLDREGRVVNVEKSPLKTANGMETLCRQPTISIERETDGLRINADSRIHDVSLSSVSGQPVRRMSVSGNAALVPTAGLHGIYVLTVNTDKGLTCRKIML